jgi:hypothetical protein
VCVSNEHTSLKNYIIFLLEKVFPRPKMGVFLKKCFVFEK